MDDITVVHGDTGMCPDGIGTFGSRAVAVGGTALMMSVDKIKAKAKRFAGNMLEALPTEIVYDAQGKLYVDGHPDKGVTIQEVAAASWNAVNLPPDTEPGLNETATSSRPTAPSRSAPTSASSRSTPRPARSSSSATSPSTTAAT